MAGLNLNFGSSVFKREAKSKMAVERHLQREGWEKTGDIGDRISYFESSGINITVVDGPMGTVILPSGPVRGTIFGVDNKLFSESSVIGAGADNENKDERSQMTGSRRTDDPMV